MAGLLPVRLRPRFSTCGASYATTWLGGQPLHSHLLIQGAEFGEERVGTIVKAHAMQSAQDRVETLLDEVERFSDARHPADDTTVIVVKRL